MHVYFKRIKILTFKFYSNLNMTDSKEDPATAAVANNQEEGKKDSGAEEKSDKAENQDEPQNQVWTPGMAECLRAHHHA